MKILTSLILDDYRQSNACKHLHYLTVKLLFYIGLFRAYLYSMCNTLWCCPTMILMAFMPVRDSINYYKDYKYDA